MPVTNEILKGLAAQACNMAKRDMERDEGFSFLLASYHEGTPLHRMKKVEALIVEKCGKNWLNSGRAKDAAFETLRIATAILPPDALIMVTMTNMFTPTEKFHALTEEQKDEIWKAGHDRHHLAVKEGALKVRDALWALAQTPETVCTYLQKYDARGRPDGQPDVQLLPQAQYGGRTKMFGKDKEDLSWLTKKS